MVKGLDLFKRHFEPFKDQYILIGGAACDLLFEEVGAEFRLTKDLDIVLCLESLNPEFARAFWKFVDEGGYEMRQRSSGRPEFYRFQKPNNVAYPFMLELFSRKPDMLMVPEGQEVIPLPTDEEVSSLSAILLDDDYYRLLRNRVTEVDGLPTVGPELLILLKAKAFLDLRSRKEQGQNIDEKKIKKHKNDVFRLSTLIDASSGFEIPNSVYSDFQQFLSVMSSEEIDLKALKIKIDKATLLSNLEAKITIETT